MNDAFEVHQDAENPHLVPCESNADEGMFVLRVVLVAGAAGVGVANAEWHLSALVVATG